MLKTFLSQEEQATSADPISVDDVYATSMDDDEGEDASRERERALSVIDQLESANETWRKIVKSAIKENRATPELCAGIEAHIQRISQELGEHVETECASIEAAGDDVELFLSQVETSLESFSGKLGKIKNAIIDSMSKMWNSKADQKRQVETFKSLGALANKIAAAIKEKHGKELNSEVVLHTGRFTTAFTSQGKVTDSPAKAIASHMVVSMDMYRRFCTVATNSIIDMLNIAENIFRAKSDKEIIELSIKVAEIPPTSMMSPARVETGEVMLGNIRLEPPKGKPGLGSDETISKYISRRGKFSAPHWVKAGPRAEAKDITLTYSEIERICKGISSDCKTLADWFVHVEQSSAKIIAKIKSIKEYNNPLARDVMVWSHVDAILKAVKAETAGGMTPIQQLAYRNMSIIRGWLGLLSKA